MNKSGCKTIWFGTLISSILIFFIGTLFENEVYQVVCMIVGLVMIFSACTFMFIFWKCPHCDRRLPTRGIIGMEHCPYCGNDINVD